MSLVGAPSLAVRKFAVLSSLRKSTKTRLLSLQRNWKLFFTDGGNSTGAALASCEAIGSAGPPTTSGSSLLLQADSRVRAATAARGRQYFITALLCALA